MVMGMLQASTATETVVDTTYTAGSGIDLAGTVFSHTDTSSQASVNNSNGIVIQDITLDGFGHITGIASTNLDGRYYTESEIDTRMSYTLYAPQNAPSDLDSISHLGWYKWANTAPANAPDAYGMLIHGRDGSQEQQLLQTYGGSSNQVSLYGRRKTSAVWDTSWTQYFSDHYHPNADKWTTARTLSLSGDASGSVSWDGSSNATLSVAVADDSHNHVWGNIDGASVGGLAGPRFTTASGWIEFGPANSSWAHINTDRPNFYFYKGANFQGNITLTGTVDGRNVLADGQKLDGIATGANNYSFPYSISQSVACLRPANRSTVNVAPHMVVAVICYSTLSVA